jgi:hypothetical protein
MLEILEMTRKVIRFFGWRHFYRRMIARAMPISILLRVYQ